MSKKVYMDSAAEREATDIGRKFMNSSDVVGDMSRTYGTDLSSVRIHTDDSAARQTAERGVDAFSTGKDVFFARNAFNKNDPASRGLLAHELSHSLQQGVGGEMGGMTQSAPMGAEQGGLIDWFRNWNRRRKEKKRLDAEDKKFARWDREGQEHVNDFMKNGLPENAPIPQAESFDMNITDMKARANELGWTNAKGEAFNDHLAENFFREISGQSLNGKEGPDGQKHGTLSTGYRSKEEMMELFNNHDEATTLRILKPLMDLDIDAFARQYPIHRMAPQERRIAFPQIDAVLQPMVGLKQWAEKYGVTTLSEANQKKLDEQIIKFENLSKWAYNIRLPMPMSFDQMYEMNVLNALDSAKGMAHTEEMQQRLSGVQDEMGAGGCMLDVEEFKRIMGKHLPGKGNDESRIDRLTRQMPGLKYNPDTKMVSCPLPLEDLRALANGDANVKKRYTDELRSMSWVKEDGSERRAGQYDATADEFMEGFEDDARYFGRMSKNASALSLFGQDFMGRQKDSADLKTRSTMAQNTYKMMVNRADKFGTPQEMSFTQQYDGVKNRTWIKRLLLGNKKNKKWY